MGFSWRGRFGSQSWRPVKLLVERIALAADCTERRGEPASGDPAACSLEPNPRPARPAESPNETTGAVRTQQLNAGSNSRSQRQRKGGQFSPTQATPHPLFGHVVPQNGRAAKVPP